MVVECVTDNSAVVEWDVWNINLHCVLLVGGCDKELASGEAEEVVKHILLLVLLVPDLVLLSDSIDGLDMLVQLAVLVVVRPERLSAVGIGTSRVALLVSIVEEWNASRSHGKGDSRLEFGLVVVEHAQESRIVVVTDKHAKSIDITERAGLFVVPRSNLVHLVLRAKDILDGVVHGIVEQSVDVALVLANIA